MFNLDFKAGYRRLRYMAHDIGLKLSGAPTIHCVGDSHLGSFEYVDKNMCLKHTRLKFCIVQGATAMGMPNPASKTQAGPIFRDYLNKVPLNDFILTCLGEVDCGFVIWYRSKKYGEPVSKQFELAVSNYLHFVNWLESIGLKNIVISSAPLPTIKDGQKWGEIASLRNEVESTLRERTDITLEFNRRLREHCLKRNHIYLDIESHILNRETRLVDDRFLNPDKLDHHLYPKVLAGVIVEELKKHGFS